MSTSTEKKIAAIPESVTLNGVTYLVKDTPELQTLIQEISKVERSKVYSQMDGIKAQLNQLSQAEVSSTPLDTTSIVNELRKTFVTSDDLKAQLKETVTEVITPLLSATRETREATLADYRNSLIEKNLAVCIPDLVVGNTKEELDSALARSIKLRAAYPPPSKQEHTVDPLIAKQAQEMKGVPPTTPEVPRSAQPAQPVQPIEQPMPEVPKIPSLDSSTETNTVKKLSLQEFAKQRDALKAELETMYGG